jgi:periplasmic protein TonB
MQRHHSFLRRFMPYGAPDLIEAAPSHLAGGVTLGSALWVGLFLTALAIGPLQRTVVIPEEAIELLPDFPPAPRILPVVETPPSTPIAAATKPVSLVDPVSDAEAPPETAVEPEPGAGQRNGPDTGGAEVRIEARTGPIVLDPDPPENLYVHRDVEATPVIQVKPEYPELARSAQVEGVVRLRALVGIDGRVRRVIVDRSVPLLDQAACDALKRWVFTPALDQGRPVAVWVAVPFRFSLH